MPQAKMPLLAGRHALSLPITPPSLSLSRERRHTRAFSLRTPRRMCLSSSAPSTAHGRLGRQVSLAFIETDFVPCWLLAAFSLFSPCSILERRKTAPHARPAPPAFAAGRHAVYIAMAAAFSPDDYQDAHTPFSLYADIQRIFAMGDMPLGRSASFQRARHETVGRRTLLAARNLIKPVFLTSMIARAILHARMPAISAILFISSRPSLTRHFSFDGCVAEAIDRVDDAAAASADADAL